MQAEQYNPHTHKGSLPISKFFCIAFSCIYLCARDAHVVGDFRFCFRPQCFVYSFFNFQFVQRLPLRHGLMMV